VASATYVLVNLKKGIEIKQDANQKKISVGNVRKTVK
jgi:hypothetical protein